MFSEVGTAVTGFLCEGPIFGASRDEVVLRVTAAFLPSRLVGTARNSAQPCPHPGDSQSPMLLGHRACCSMLCALLPFL